MNHVPFDICRAALVVAAALFVAAGCGQKDTRVPRVPVSGTVLHKGEPVADATVVFEPMGSTPAAAGKTDTAGRFRLTTFDTDDGAVPGEYKVSVRKVQVLKSNKPPASDDAVGPPSEEKWLLPAKYGITASSGFAATVTENGENDFKFELEE